jgi:translocation and assembly module TamA
VENREAVVDHDTRTLNVTWRVDPGPRARFGRARLEGLASVDEAYVRQFITWQAGDIYDQREVAATRSNLQDTNLFAAVDVVRGEPRDGELPITLRLTEGEHRSLGFTARFSTSQGPSATAFWEHRNILGRHETLRTELDVGLITQELSGSFSKPRFLRENQSLDSDLSLRRQDSDAFDERSISGEVGLARDFENDISASLGGSAEMTVTEDNEGERTFALIGIPLSVTRSTRNSGLNPTSGSRISLDATPYAVTVDDTLGFMRNELNATTYYAVDEAERLILAARGRFGTILGQKTPDIPPSKRFFAGGGGSLRGFDFQSVGPLDDDNDPLGGRSVIEGSFEVRWRITETIGIVPFIDVGNVYDDPLPFLDQGDNEPFRVGAGLGARYHTPIGPLRVDVARALDQRDVDDAFELYISFGQAF